MTDPQLPIKESAFGHDAQQFPTLGADRASLGQRARSPRDHCTVETSSWPASSNRPSRLRLQRDPLRRIPTLCPSSPAAKTPAASLRRASAWIASSAVMGRWWMQPTLLPRVRWYANVAHRHAGLPLRQTLCAYFICQKLRPCIARCVRAGLRRFCNCWTYEAGFFGGAHAFARARASWLFLEFALPWHDRKRRF